MSNAYGVHAHFFRHESDAVGRVVQVDDLAVFDFAGRAVDIGGHVEWVAAGEFERELALATYVGRVDGLALAGNLLGETTRA